MTNTLFTRTFWFDAGERALKTAAQAVLLAWGLSQGPGPVDGFGFDWQLGASAALGGLVLSILTSIVSAPIGNNGTASALPSPPGPEAPPDAGQSFVQVLYVAVLIFALIALGIWISRHV
jgi:hypothetical protein